MVISVYIALSSTVLRTRSGPLSPTTAVMAATPSNSQRLQSFHPDYQQEVFMIVFSVCAIISLFG